MAKSHRNITAQEESVDECWSKVKKKSAGITKVLLTNVLSENLSFVINSLSRHHMFNLFF